ncbi:unnamed protein product, partial [marine sediment metagenome]
CLMMVTDPEFVDEMVAFWTEFVMRTLEPILERVELDCRVCRGYGLQGT